MKSSTLAAAAILALLGTSSAMKYSTDEAEFMAVVQDLTQNSQVSEPTQMAQTEAETSAETEAQTEAQTQTEN